MQTKLVCTLGPATEGRMRELVAAGMNVARINFSHGTEAEHSRAAEAVRAASRDAGRPVGLMIDLSGPKIRLGALVDDMVELTTGDPFLLRDDLEPGDRTGAATSYSRLGEDLRSGDRILLADGAAELRVTAVGAAAGAAAAPAAAAERAAAAAAAEGVLTEVVRGGTVRSRSGVNVPADRLSGPSLTGKDRADIPRALSLGADYLAQSFVRRASDVQELREELGAAAVGIVAKIETRAAVDDLEAILKVADGIMVARGDLGVEIPFEEVPLVQKDLVGRARAAGVPVIIATQMLESMTDAPRPTRAEASDVANAVLDGADAVMLSAETAVGCFPIEAADAAARICRAAERPVGNLSQNTGGQVGDALGHAAVTLARRDPEVAAIACLTRSGRTAWGLSALRPPVPILAFSPDAAVLGRLTLAWGVLPAFQRMASDTESSVGRLRAGVQASGLVPPGRSVVFVASTGAEGAAPNLLQVHRVGGR